MFLKYLLFFTLFSTQLESNWFEEKKRYNVSPDPIDVIIVCHEKDRCSLELCIENARKNINNVQRIITVSATQLTEKAEWFNESKYPFSKQNIEKIFTANNPHFYQNKKNLGRIGWYYQQLLKLYTAFVIPNISSNILILDADTFFLKPTAFVDNKGIMLHSPGKENYQPYFGHMAKLLPGLKRVFDHYSGISHHMLFQRPILEDLFNLVEKHHQKSFWEAFCNCVNPKDMKFSGASEYEIYFNFLVTRTDQYKIRLLRADKIKILSHLPKYQNLGFDVISYHSHSRLD